MGRNQAVGGGGAGLGDWRKAATSKKAFTTIFTKLDISARTLRGWLEDDPELALANEQGRAERSEWLQEQKDKAIEEKPGKSPLLMLAMANQAADAGRFSQNRKQTGDCGQTSSAGPGEGQVGIGTPGP